MNFCGLKLAPSIWVIQKLLPLLARAINTLRSGRVSMEALILVAAGAAYALSVVNLLTGERAVYFDSATAALVLATLGRYLEAKARSHAHAVLGPTVDTSRQPVRHPVGSADVEEHRTPSSPAGRLPRWRG